MLAGKKILIGVTGSIAAYKIPLLVRLLKKAGAEVQLILSESAADFVSPIVLSTLSQKDVLSEIVNPEAAWNNHVALGEWADLFIIAPATANTLAKLSHGICDNLLTAVYLSARCPVWVSPAMDHDMYGHFTTKANLKLLQENQIHVIEPEFGELASGIIGNGRLPEPEHLFKLVNQFFTEKQELGGIKVLVTAGPTHEPIDPVRYVGNRSTGKMGIEIAKAFAARGALVDLVCGPANKPLLSPDIRVTDVLTAQEMYEACTNKFQECQILVMAAAVADYKPSSPSSQKIKKSELDFNINLAATPDILKTLAHRKNSNQFVVGFALESDNHDFNARKKLQDKQLDMLILNYANEKGAGIGYDTNHVFVYSNTEGDPIEIPMKPKSQVATEIVDLIVKARQ